MNEKVSFPRAVQPFLTGILLLVIALSLLLMVFVTYRLIERTRFSGREIVTYRNYTLQRVIDQRIRILESAVTGAVRAVGDTEPNREITLLRALADIGADVTESDWVLVDREHHRLMRLVNGSLYSQNLEQPFEDGSRFVRVLSSERGMPRLGVTFATPGLDSLVPVLLGGSSVAEFLQLQTDYGGGGNTTALLITAAGNVVVDESSLFSTSRRGEVSSAGNLRFTASADLKPYLGVVNRYFRQTDDLRPTVFFQEDGIYSHVPLPEHDAYMVLRDDPTLTPRNGFDVRFLIIGTVVTIYGIIVFLFIAYRRTIVRISRQKDAMFSLLSHNLKNDLAALSVEVGRGRIDSLSRIIDHTSAVVTDSLYAVRFMEKRFPRVHLERIPVDEIIDLLRLRVEEQVSAQGYAWLEQPLETPAEVSTNLGLLLDALERTVNAFVVGTDEGGSIAVVGTDGPDFCGIEVTVTPSVPAPISEGFGRGFVSLQGNATAEDVSISVASGLFGILRVSCSVAESAGDATKLLFSFPSS